MDVEAGKDVDVGISTTQKVQLPLAAKSVRWDERGTMIRTPTEITGEMDLITKRVVNDVWNGPVPDNLLIEQK